MKGQESYNYNLQHLNNKHNWANGLERPLGLKLLSSVVMVKDRVRG